MIKRGITHFRNLFYVSSVILFLSACSGPSQSALTAVSGFTEPTATVPVPLADSAITFSPASHDYGTVLVNVGTPTKTFTVLNASAYSLTLTSLLSANANFSIQANQCAGTLESFDSCTFDIQFAPTTSGVLNSLVTLSYTSPSVTGTFSSVLSVTGSSTSLVAFAGLTSVTQVSTTSVKLNWTGIAGVSSYQAYDVTSGRTLISSMLPAGACVGTVCSYVVNGLTPNTTYTYQLRATDLGGVQEGNIISQTVTTQTVATFSTISDISGSENTAFNTANLSCTDAYSNSNLFSIANQSDAALNCALTATTGASAKVSCTPAYKAAAGVHNPWSGTVTVQCVINGSNYSKTFTVNVTNTNRNPAIQLSLGATQTVSAQLPMSLVTATDINTNGTTDIDGDALAFTCSFSGGGFGAGTNCTSLPQSSYSMNAATGVMNWTPSLSAAVGGNATTYAMSISGDDGHGGIGAASFNVTVDPGLALSISAGTTTTTTTQLSWTKITGAANYLIYRLSPFTPLGTVSAGSCAGPCIFTDTGLTAATTYTYRVVALDGGGNTFSTSLDTPITTKNLGSFTAISALAANENANSQTPLMTCTDTYSNTNLFSITAQSDSTANCSLTATTGASAKVSCTPAYHASGGTHANWTDNVTVQCTLNGTNYSRTFAVNVANINRSPVATIGTVTNPSPTATLNTTTFSVTDPDTSGTTDIDGDTLHFSCSYTGGAVGATPTNCASLPGTYSLGATSGLFSWLPSATASTSAGATAYTITITVDDLQVSNHTATAATVINVQPAVLLGAIVNRTFETGKTPLVVGSTFTNTFNNTQQQPSPGVTNMSYTCY